jgi:O-antigen/teichoic acid export membrane protein
MMSPDEHASPELAEPIPSYVRNPIRSVLSNATAQVAVKGVVALAGVVQAAILSHYLHSTGYGQYSFVLAAVGIVGIITDLGLSLVAVRALSQVKERSPRTVGALLIARCLLALLGVAVCDLFVLVSPLDSVERVGILVVSPVYLISVPIALSAVFQAEMEIQYSLIATLAQYLFGFLLVVGLVLAHVAIVPLLAVQLVAAAVGAVVTLRIAMGRYRLSFAWSLSAALHMVWQALPVGIGATLITVYFRIDSILLGLLRGPVDVAHYTAAYKFIDLAYFGAVALMAAIYPLMVRRSGEGERHRLIRAYQAAVDVMMFVALPLTVAWLILAGPMVFLVYPSDFAATVGAFRILCLALVPLFFNAILAPLSLTLHMEKIFVWVWLSAAVVNIGLNLPTIPAFGINAAAVVTVISELVVTAVAGVLITRELRYLPSPRFFLLALLASAAMAPPVYALRDIWPVAVLAGGLCYLALARLFGLWSWELVRETVLRSSIS